MTHRTFKPRQKSSGGSPSLARLGGVVPASFISAAKQASKRMAELGVSHVLIGGMAVGAHGYPRPTKDVDFLVGEEAFEHHGSIVTLQAGLPIAVGKVAIDMVSLGSKERSICKRFLRLPTEGVVPIIPIEALVYMKLHAGRQRDRGDVVELIKVGAVDDKKMSAFLRKNAPSLLRLWYELSSAAESEN